MGADWDSTKEAWRAARARDNLPPTGREVYEQFVKEREREDRMIVRVLIGCIVLMAAIAVGVVVWLI